VQFPDFVNQLVRLTSPSKPLYLVGGAVRDALLGKPCSDFDFVCAQDPRPMARAFANWNRGNYFVLDEERLICRVLIDSAEVPDLIVDFAIMRGENILEDLAHRDFTINAMAVDLNQPEQIIDPFKGGRDLLEKRLRVVSPNSFIEDPLRIIRAVRYTVDLGLTLAPETIHLVRAAVDGLQRVSVERKRDELFKIFSGHKVHTALQLCMQFGVIPYLPLTIPLNFSPLVTRIRSLEDILDWLCGVKPHARQAAFYQSSLLVELGRFREDLRRFYLAKNPSKRDRRSLLFLSVILGEEVEPGNHSRALALSVEEMKQVSDYKAAIPLLQGFIDRGSIPEPLEIYRYFKATAAGGVDAAVVALAEQVSRVGCEFVQEQWLYQLKLAAKLMDAWFKSPQLLNPDPLLNGDDLMRRFSLSPGPFIGELLELLKEQQIKGSVTSASEAWRWLEGELKK
jgi:tRNA nucleotidyltransferase/poly(A) polymerase